MHIFITGGSGFVGTALSSHLLKIGHSVVSTGTSPAHKYLKHANFRYISADTTQKGSWQDHIKNADAVINLTGANILHFWTENYKQKICVNCKNHSSRDVDWEITLEDFLNTKFSEKAKKEIEDCCEDLRQKTKNDDRIFPFDKLIWD